MNTLSAPLQEKLLACGSKGASCAADRARKGFDWVRRHPESGMVVAFALGFLVGLSATNR
jgi:hypothetical protein